MMRAILTSLICYAPDCPNNRKKRGRYCSKHENRLYKWGKLEKLDSEDPWNRRGEKGGNWKGDKRGVPAAHQRLYIRYGKANKCENESCNQVKPKRYEWANLTGKYLDDRSDWAMLCSSCHKRYDYGSNPIVIDSKTMWQTTISRFCKKNINNYKDNMGIK